MSDFPYDYEYPVEYAPVGFRLVLDPTEEIPDGARYMNRNGQVMTVPSYICGKLASHWFQNHPMYFLLVPGEEPDPYAEADAATDDWGMPK